jgi:hypothetical protein
MLVAKSIRTGCDPTSGNPVLLNSQVVSEHDGCRSRSRSEDEHRGQRTLRFHRSVSARAATRSMTEDANYNLATVKKTSAGSAAETDPIRSH